MVDESLKRGLALLRGKADKSVERALRKGGATVSITIGDGDWSPWGEEEAEEEMEEGSSPGFSLKRLLSQAGE